LVQASTFHLQRCATLFHHPLKPVNNVVLHNSCLGSAALQSAVTAVHYKPRSLPTKAVCCMRLQSHVRPSDRCTRGIDVVPFTCSSGLTLHRFSQRVAAFAVCTTSLRLCLEVRGACCVLRYSMQHVCRGRRV
jgi:hypothetical protein